MQLTVSKLVKMGPANLYKYACASPTDLTKVDSEDIKINLFEQQE